MSLMRVRIWYKNDQDLVKIPVEMENMIFRVITETLRMEDRKGHYEVGITFTDNEKIRELNRIYRNLDCPTDVLSFPILTREELKGNDKDRPVWGLGDIVISMTKAVAQGEVYGHGTNREVAFLITHALLHLLGYDHELSDEDDQIMRAKQNEVMRRMGMEVR